MSREVWDLYFPDGRPAGRQMLRGERVPAGLCHLVCEALVRHTDGDYLLMRRSMDKTLYPGRWEATAGGSALRGEDAAACIRRELLEETGIGGGDLRLISRQLVRGDTLFFCWLCVTDWDKSAIRLQAGETDAFRWLSEEEFIRFIHSGGIIDVQYDRWLPWYREMGYAQ